MKNLLLVAGNNIGCVSVHAQRIIFCSNENRYNAVVKCNINLKSSCRFMSGGFFPLSFTEENVLKYNSIYRSVFKFLLAFKESYQKHMI